MEAGDYSAESEAILLKLKAEGCMVIVIGGERGHGFSISTDNPAIAREFPKMLRLVAEDMEKQQAQSSGVPINLLAKG